MTIHCTLCMRDESGTYHRNPYITLLSLFENTQEPVHVHFLHDDTIHHGRKALEDLCARYGQTISFYRVPEMDPDFVATISRWFNIGTLYRYFVADCIPAEKVIYLDCDVIVNRNIKELYDLDIGNHLVAAVKDKSHYWDKKGNVRPKYRKKIAWLGINKDTCFAAGVMVFNLARLRAHNETSPSGNIFMAATQKALAEGIDLQYPDQDIMNSVCAALPEGLLLIDESFNSYSNILHLSLEESRGRIIQFMSDKREPTFFPGHLIFWKYYAMSPYAGDMIERMNEAFKSRPMAFFKNYAMLPKRRRKAADLLEVGFLGMCLRAAKRALGRHTRK